MDIPVELPVGQARDHFSEVVNRAAFGGEITFITRGRSSRRAAAVVPAELVEMYEQLVDREDGRVASQRLADLRAGKVEAVPLEEAAAELGL